MKKRNKIISIVMLSLLVIGVVSAVIVDYYGERQTTLNVVLPIEVTGLTEETIDGMGCGQVTGTPITIKNLADKETGIKIISECKEEGEDCDTGAVETSYIGTLELTKKDITTWIPSINEEDKIEITYTIVGDTFESSGVPEGYTLIYYKDNEANADDIERLLVLGESTELSENMPHTDDWNTGELANYCDMANTYDDYEQCKGAKIWVVPDASIVGGVLVWSNPGEFYFETNLIQYNKEGRITMSPNSTLVIKPVFDLDCMLVGTVVINTTIDNV